jgi:phage terminase large subunit-like protein
MEVINEFWMWLKKKETVSKVENSLFFNPDGYFFYFISTTKNLEVLQNSSGFVILSVA